MTVLIHTSDWHLGKTFYRQAADPERQQKLRQERFRAVEALGAAAEAEGAAAVLVAGDVFHSNEVSDRVIVAALDAIGRIGIPVVAIPGNHDSGGAGSVWERPSLRDQLQKRAPNLVVLQGGPCLHRVGDVDVLALPVMERFQAVRLRDLAPLVDQLRPSVGLVHASVGEFDEDGGGRSLDLHEGDSLGLAYLAMGDYHRRQAIPGLPYPSWYSGTHEPDNFPSHRQTGLRAGGCLRIEISGHENADVRSLDMGGGMRWIRLRALLRGEEDLDRLEAELSDHASGRAQRTMCCVDVADSELGFAGMQRLRQLQARLEPDFELLSFEGEVREAPTGEELGALSEFPGLPGLAAQRLQEISADPVRGALALAALARLHRSVRT